MFIKEELNKLRLATQASEQRQKQSTRDLMDAFMSEFGSPITELIGYELRLWITPEGQGIHVAVRGIGPTKDVRAFTCIDGIIRFGPYLNWRSKLVWRRVCNEELHACIAAELYKHGTLPLQCQVRQDLPILHAEAAEAYARWVNNKEAR